MDRQTHTKRTISTTALVEVKKNPLNEEIYEHGLILEQANLLIAMNDYWTLKEKVWGKKKSSTALILLGYTEFCLLWFLFTLPDSHISAPL